MLSFANAKAPLPNQANCSSFGSISRLLPRVATYLLSSQIPTSTAFTTTTGAVSPIALVFLRSTRDPPTPVLFFYNKSMSWKKLSWDDLDFHLDGRLVLRHNKFLQYGYTPTSDQTLREALQHMASYCRQKPFGNPKITGFIAVVRCTRIGNRPLMHVLTEKLCRNINA